MTKFLKGLLALALIPSLAWGQVGPATRGPGSNGTTVAATVADCANVVEGCKADTKTATTMNGYLQDLDAIANSATPGAVNLSQINGNSAVVNNTTDAQAGSGTNLPVVAYPYGWNGTGWDRLQVDGSKFLKVNCAVGCGAGTTSNASSGVATSSANGANVTWAYAFNGTTWDQLQVDALKNLKVIVNAPIVAGTNLIGKVGIDQTTPGATNNVTTDGVVDGATGVQSFASTGVQNGTTIPTAGYGFIGFQTPSIAAGVTFIVQVSNDGGTTWTSSTFWRIDVGTQAAIVSGTPSATQTFIAPVSGALMRFGTTAQTSGTFTINYTLKKGVPPAPGTPNVQAASGTPVAVAGTQAALATRTGNAATIGGSYKTNTTAATTGQAQDIATDPMGNLGVAAYTGMQLPETCSSGNIANATTACTLATAAGKTTYIAGFSMTSDGATATLGVTCTLTGTITGTMSFTYVYEATTIPSAPLTVLFDRPVPASAVNTTIVASCPASGAGGAHATMSAWGFQQ